MRIVSRDFTRAHVSHSTFLSILLTQQFALTQVTPPPLGTDGANNGEVSEKFDSAEEEVCFTRAHVSHSIFLSILLTQQFALTQVTLPPLGTDGANNGEVSEKFDSAEEEVCFTRAHVSHSIFLSILLTQQFSLRRSLRRSRPPAAMQAAICQRSLNSPKKRCARAYCVRIVRLYACACVTFHLSLHSADAAVRPNAGHAPPLGN